MMYKLSYGTFENSHYITASHVTRFHNAARGFRVSLPHDTPKNLGSWHKFGYAWEHSQRHRIVSTNQCWALQVCPSSAWALKDITFHLLFVSIRPPTGSSYLDSCAAHFL